MSRNSWFFPARMSRMSSLVKSSPPDVNDLVVRMVFVDGVGDGVEQMGLAQAGLPVDEQGVVVLRRVLGYRQGGGVGQLVGVAHHEALEGVFLRSRQKPGDLLGILVLGLLLLLQDHHVDLGGEELEEGFLDLLPIPVVEDPLLKLCRDRQDELVLVQRHCLNVGKPGGDGGLRQVLFQNGEHSLPNFRGGVHVHPPSWVENGVSPPESGRLSTKKEGFVENPIKNQLIISDFGPGLQPFSPCEVGPGPGPRWYVPYGWSGLLPTLGRSAPGARLPGGGPAFFIRKQGERIAGLRPAPGDESRSLLARSTFWDRDAAER